MKLDVSATRHPSAGSRLLVSVQDQNGPIERLTSRNFEVFMWESRLPRFQGVLFTWPLPVTAAQEVAGAPGFYALMLGALVVTYQEQDETETFPADDLGPIVLGVMATRGDDRGNAVAVTPLRAEAP